MVSKTQHEVFFNLLCSQREERQREERLEHRWHLDYNDYILKKTELWKAKEMDRWI